MFFKERQSCAWLRCVKPELRWCDPNSNSMLCFSCWGLLRWIQRGAVIGWTQPLCLLSLCAFAVGFWLWTSYSITFMCVCVDRAKVWNDAFSSFDFLEWQHIKHCIYRPVIQVLTILVWRQTLTARVDPCVPLKDVCAARMCASASVVYLCYTSHLSM